MSLTGHRSSRCVFRALWVGVRADGERMTVGVLWQFEIWGFFPPLKSQRNAIFLRNKFVNTTKPGTRETAKAHSRHRQ